MEPVTIDVPETADFWGARTGEYRGSGAKCATQRLVVQGVYRYVRNPMISGVFFVLLGEAVLAASLPLFIWFGVFAIGNAVYIPLAEEPGLVKRFGDDYLTYKLNVPRWIPRLTPWDGQPHE